MTMPLQTTFLFTILNYYFLLMYFLVTPSLDESLTIEVILFYFTNRNEIKYIKKKHIRFDRHQLRQHICFNNHLVYLVGKDYNGKDL